MKTNEIWMITAILLAAAAAAAFAQTEADFTVEVTSDGDGVVINGYTGKTAAVKIPAAIQGMPVREIGWGAFQESGITSVVIPAGVTLIDNMAFYRCNKLAQVTLPDSLTTIGRGAFEYCEALRTIVLPDSVTTLGSWDGAGAFTYSGLTSITLSRNLTSISDFAFASCKRLTNVVIPEGVTSIGMYAFSGCTALASLTLPSTIKGFDMYAFAGCSALSQVFIPGEVSSISFGEGSFEGCSKLPLAAQAALRKRGYGGRF
jgi:hypothetical protein